MSLKTVSPAEARTLLDRGAVLIDIRERDEHAREHIGAARHQPLSALPSRLDEAGAGPVIFHCKAGSRTTANAERLAAASPCEAYLLEGGIEAWKAAGLPVNADRKAPIEIMRQVQITAGSLVVLGAVLGATVAPGFHALSAAVGAGLLFAGVSGSCMMASLLARMPWNKVGQRSAETRATGSGAA